MTGMYNVLEKLRLGEELSDKERKIHTEGLVSVLAQLHDDLDAAVLDAYGWSDLAPALVGKPGGTTPCRTKSREQEEAEEALLQRLVDLNAARGVLAEQPGPALPDQLARSFKRARTARVTELLETLVQPWGKPAKRTTATPPDRDRQLVQAPKRT